jgi:hypothetical protein
MIKNSIVLSAGFAAAVTLACSTASAAPKKAAPEIQLTVAGRQLETKYAADLKALKAEIEKGLPTVSSSKKAALQKASEATKAAQQEADAAQKALGSVGTAKALVEHAKGKWIGGAEKGIAQAEAALKKAATDAEREAAKKDLAKWQANKEDGLKALQERQAALDKAKGAESKLNQAHQSAQTALTKARAEEMNAFKNLMADLTPVLAGGKLDAKLVRATVLTAATPQGLAEFAQQGSGPEALTAKLLADDKLMLEMLTAGGPVGGQYGRAMQIYAAIQQASPKAAGGVLQRLALATSLEHAVPVKQSNADDRTDAPATVDPVKRYQHYEKAWLDGELDPAFKDFTTWEYRMVVDDDAPDHILAWGREMLRTYRPDHITTPNYGWRYAAAVKTDVRYGSQNVSNDLPSLNTYQNIPMNGGVCGRRAFFGRFILRSFGIPVWGVTQHKHAAVSHWTPNGWVVNLGAGFNASWWDKDDVPRSGSDFLLETQAREHGSGYLPVLRAQWISRVLGEPAYNDRKQTAGGFWSSIGHHQAVALASKAVELGPLGQELAEANESKESEKAEHAAATEADRKTVVKPDGHITLPAVAHVKPAGSFSTMKSFSGGMQIHCKGGYKAQQVFDAPRAGRYALTARVASFEGGQKFLLTANEAKQPVEAAVPFTIGLWQETPPVEVTLVKGRNVLDFTLPPASRGVTLKEFSLKPI